MLDQLGVRCLSPALPAPVWRQGIDQRMLEILRVKADEFDEYARRSDLKDITPDAVDISDLTTAAQVASQAENERRIVEMERKRLRMEEAEREGR
jgi:hypothetical protein